MRYGKLYGCYWTSPDIVSLPIETKAIGAYLLTTEHGNMIGCFRLPIAYAVEDLRISSGTVSKGFENLSERGFIVYDSLLSWVLIKNFLKWNSIENPNQGKAAAKLVNDVPRNSSIYAPLTQILKSNPANFPDGFLNGLETLTEPFRNQEQEQEHYQQPQPQPQPQLLASSDETSLSAGATVFDLPLLGNGTYGVPRALLDSYVKAYPGISVMAELEKMHAWLLSNTKKQKKTCNGMTRFMNSWLARAQNDAPIKRGKNDAARISPAVERQRASDDAIRKAAALLEGAGGAHEPGSLQLRSPGADVGNVDDVVGRLA